MSGYQHVGFGLSFLRAEFQSRFRRMVGFNVLHPQGFHCTGLPILGAAKRVAEGEGRQIAILRDMGVPAKDIPKFADPAHWIDVFPSATLEDLRSLGAAVDWRRYGLEQRGGSGVPFGPAIILVHVCSTKVPYTSEAKEAAATIPEIMTELDLALKESGRRLKTHLSKKARREKTREKFEIVQKILPQIAAKSANIVGKKVPSLDATITKIMGVVWIEEAVAFEKGTHTVTIDVHNFTPAGKKLNLHALLPRNGWKLGKVDPKPAEVRDDGKITWELKRIGSVEKATVTFELLGLEKGEYDESDLYVSGIPPELVIGAEPLPGDWELNYKEFEQEEAPPPEEEEEEIDYDEAAEKELGDE